MIRQRPVIIAQAKVVPRPCVHRTVLIVMGLLMALAAALAVLRANAQQRLIRYRHTLDYPSYQTQELIQVGSIDRG